MEGMNMDKTKLGRLVAIAIAVVIAVANVFGIDVPVVPLV